MGLQKQSIGQKQTLKQTASQQTVQFMRMLEMPANRIEEEILKAVDENPALEIDIDADIHDLNYDSPDFNDTEENAGDETEELRSDSRISDDDFEDFFYTEDFDSDYDYENERELDYQLRNMNVSKDDKMNERVVVNNSSMQENLLAQLGVQNITPDDRKIAAYIIGNLDNSGYLSQDNGSIVSDLLLTYNISTTVQNIERIITHYIQTLDPPGVGARDLQECILIQLKRLAPTPSVKLAIRIIEKHFSEFCKKHYDKILSQLAIDEEELRNAVLEIHKLDPRPANNQSVTEQASAYITPDFTITMEGDQLVLTLNTQFLPKLKINKDYQQQYAYLNTERNAKIRADAEKYFKENIDNAVNFIHSLSQRELTMYNIMHTIMQKQRQYFLTGNDFHLKPMVLKDIAEIVGVDISTVSRVTNNKYVQTPFGTIPLKHLFSESIGDESISSKEVKTIIAEIIERENKNSPMTDEQICSLLSEKGYSIARRTVAKYREQSGFPVARMRKQI